MPVVGQRLYLLGISFSIKDETGEGCEYLGFNIFVFYDSLVYEELMKRTFKVLK